MTALSRSLGVTRVARRERLRMARIVTPSPFISTVLLPASGQHEEHRRDGYQGWKQASEASPAPSEIAPCKLRLSASSLPFFAALLPHQSFFLFGFPSLSSLRSSCWDTAQRHEKGGRLGATRRSPIGGVRLCARIATSDRRRVVNPPVVMDCPEQSPEPRCEPCVRFFKQGNRP